MQKMPIDTVFELGIRTLFYMQLDDLHLLVLCTFLNSIRSRRESITRLDNRPAHLACIRDFHSAVVKSFT